MRVCELLVGLGDVEVLGVDDEAGAPLRVHVRLRSPRPACGACGGPLWSNGERPVALVDLPAFGRPALLVQQAPVALPESGVLGGDRHRAGPPDCAAAGEADDARGPLGDAPGRAGPPAGRGRRRVGLQLASGERVGAPLGRGAAGRRHAAPRRHRGARARRAPDGAPWPVPGQGLGDQRRRCGPGPAVGHSARQNRQTAVRWIKRRPRGWLAQIRWAVLDLSDPYRSAFDEALPHAGQVADPFCVVRLGDDALDDVRRRVAEPDPRAPRPQRRPAVSGAQAARQRVRADHRLRPPPAAGPARRRRPLRRGPRSMARQRDPALDL